jgi:head-tail adaptor
MAKTANAGELRTPIVVEAYTETQGGNMYAVKTWANVFGAEILYRVKWVNAHGAEVFEAMRLELNEPATLTGRYSALITKQCRILLAADSGKSTADKEKLYYEIISVDDVENRHEWLEIKVKRQVSAK